MDDTKPKGPLSPRERDRERASKSLNARARKLRQHSTDAERRLWHHLRAHRFAGYKFKRQVPLGAYIADFVCFEAALIIEADGGQHAEQGDYDAQRTAALERLGFRVVRFWNHEILAETEAVLERIRCALIESPSPCPSPGGRGDPSTGSGS